MEIDVTNRIHYNNYYTTNERPRGYYLDLSDIPSGCDINSSDYIQDVGKKVVKFP